MWPGAPCGTDVEAVHDLSIKLDGEDADAESDFNIPDDEDEDEDEPSSLNAGTFSSPPRCGATEEKSTLCVHVRVHR